MTRKLAVPLLTLLLAVAAAPIFADTPAPSTDDEKAVYTIGLMLHRNLATLGLTDAELQLVLRAISDAHAGKPAVKAEEFAPKVQGFVQARAESRGPRRPPPGSSTARRWRGPAPRPPPPTRSRSTTAARSSTAPSSTARSGAASRPSSR